MRRLLPPLAAVLLAAAPAAAVIKVLTPLKQVLAAEESIFVATVESVDPAKPAVVFAFAEDLKGKAPVQRLAVNLTGDSFAKKDDHTKVMLDRLAAGRKLVLFASKVGAGGYSCFGYLDGTWFQLRGTKDGDAVRWAFLHCEPYFRRTFKGTTDELKAVVVESLAGKRTPPEPDEKEPPGYGPVPGSGFRVPGPGATDPIPGTRNPTLFAVIPSFVLLGPLAIVAALFPGVAARLAMGMTRWRAFLVVASVNSTLALAYYLLRNFGLLPDTRLLSPPALAAVLLAVTVVGLVWAGRRYRRLGSNEPDVTAPPTRNELLALVGLTAGVGLLVALTAWLAGWWGEAVYLAGTKVEAREATGLGKEFTAIGVGLLAATLYAAYRAATRGLDGPAPGVRLSLSGESVGLAAMLVFGVVMLVTSQEKERGSLQNGGEVAAAGAADVRLWFESPDFTEVMSGVAVEGNRVYFGAAKASGFRQSGAVVCVDRDTAKEVWRFDDDGGLAPVFGTPAMGGGRVFAGEGLHTDSDRRLFALDAATGKPAWANPVGTKSHTEGSPAVADGRVIFSAGDDGLFAASAADGKVVWQVKGAEGKLHVDNPVAVSGNRVFAGSGYRGLALLCVAADTGAEVWRTPVPLRSFGRPLVLGDRVVYGLGTGNLAEDLSQEDDGLARETTAAGAVVCVDAATGKVVWTRDLPKSVHTPPAADGRTVYAACRDGTLYALNRSTGAVRWARPLGSPLTAGPAVADDGGVPVAVYAVTTDGLLACVSPLDGAVRWTRDLRELAGRDVQVLSTPRVVPAADGKRHVYFGAGLTNRNSGAKSAAVFRVEDGE